MKRNGRLLVVMLLSVVLIVSLLPEKVDAAQPHTLYSVSYQTVYYDPSVKNAEAALIIGIAVRHPTVKKFKRFKDWLSYFGLYKAYLAIISTYKAEPGEQRLVIETVTYKAKNPTNAYWGYYRVNIYNAKTRTKTIGTAKVIGKTSY